MDIQVCICDAQVGKYSSPVAITERRGFSYGQETLNLENLRIFWTQWHIAAI